MILAFLSASGGVGKTTIAMHLAHKFLSEGRRVLLVDLDPSAGLSVALLEEEGVARLEEEKKTVGDALFKFIKGDSVKISDYVVEVQLGEHSAHLAPSGDFLSDAMGLLWFSGNRPSPEQLLRRFLEEVGAGAWDVVLLDTLPFYERRYTLSAFYAADKIVLVTHPYGAEAVRVRRMYKKLTEAVHTGADIKARVLINKVDVSTREARQAFEIVKKIDLPRFQTVVHQRVAYTRVPQMEYVRDKKAREELDSLFRELKEWLNVELNLF
ncbi:MAG: ParA family protein [Pyrobaculum sp.]